MDSTAHVATRHSDIIKELLSRVMHGFDSPHCPRDSEITNKTAVTGDAWIRQPTSSGDSDIINELLSRVTHGFDMRNSP